MNDGTCGDSSKELSYKAERAVQRSKRTYRFQSYTVDTLPSVVETKGLSALSDHGVQKREACSTILHIRELLMS